MSVIYWKKLHLLIKPHNSLELNRNIRYYTRSICYLLLKGISSILLFGCTAFYTVLNITILQTYEILMMIKLL